MKKITFLIAFLFFLTDVSSQIVNIPDANFKAKLLEASLSNYIATDASYNPIKIDLNDNGEIEVNEVLQVKQLYVTSSSISSLLGISSFINLERLYCDQNQLTNLNLTGLNNIKEIYCYINQLSSLNVSGLNNLESLNCGRNQLSSLNLTGLDNLQNLTCNDNRLTSLDLLGLNNLTQLLCSGNQLSNLDLTGLSLTDLHCDSNQLTTLDVSNLNNLTALSCSFNQLSVLDLRNLNNLQTLNCSVNQISTLDITGLTNLDSVMCAQNEITTLNLSGLENLRILYCQINPLISIDTRELNKLTDLNCCCSNSLTTLILKNDSSFSNMLNFSGCPNLHYICTDDSKISSIQNLITSYGYTNYELNTYCTFLPAGTYYTIQGNILFDLNNNGCDSADIATGNSNLNFTDGTNAGREITSTPGNYNIDVKSGTHTITPILENPTYFNVSPTSTTVSFPTQASPFIQDFCITSNGNHYDLEVTLLPTNPARPGFDAVYKIIYKNKGTTTQSGLVNLTFDDAVLDFVSANPTITNQSVNNLTWDFTNLLPFETREITLILNVNSPMETPAVNNGDILDFTTSITSPATDETPNDNAVDFHQTVVGSYDPNDKTCLEGTTISPTMVGEYVHYVIRFENTGTFPAENIVVKDRIDLAKFDINTLIPIKGSHEFVTKISDNNKVEFIFENINLPFDDANNDGFVAFKIKTKSSLVLGDTFTNSANIYFDYNFPIVTNTATTTIQTLGKQDFEFSKYFTVYPSPASSTLNLNVKNGITVSSISIYNTLGQLVIAIPNAQSVSNIDVSNLKTGSYFIKMNTDKGSANTKFVKH